MQKRLGVKVFYNDGDTSHTRFNGTAEEAEEYFVGTPFNFGWCDGKEIFKTCVKIETYE
ncbi:hypothetical protein SAMN04487969_102483 [Paenibacillus algorifonticola]|uniref:Uncharacterized protein n=1 Tax=Paenibacillus algorifonticola TaxID=684063 RepID=A0A1I2AGI6_9BACL|nr:hypothetical protein [Paenibacillus algorifonticola]SFE43095.1 hypothetical protein SAMN04487969_102483 [Paenibacillus algorifonticola]